ncbi:hypothetical protein CXB51_008135 [Gossypium anomalum]|uniref:Reverse transcriptase Ty1/copia-type domain-containing protein n=1 Tax=Gossypium anomalum TaxID=47600 RepID=A0A8J5YZI4_9ROSI|nr:hypothetical protein CXB51_008135 [Gossypium anomalum]
MASLNYEILLLDISTRFALWQIKMQAILAQMDLEEALLGDVMKEKTVAGLWKRLEQICMSKTLTSKLHMKQHFYAHCLEKCASVHEHLTVFKEILSNLDAMEVQYDKEDLGERVSLFVGDKIRMLMMIVEGHRNRILANKIKREAANQKEKQPENSGEANIVEDYNDGELLVPSVNNSKLSKEWILDSSCTFHMRPNRDWFTTYKTFFEGVVFMGNNASCKISGVGTIKVKMFDGVLRTLSDVRHVPKLKRNLISLSTLDSKWYKYTAKIRVLKISKASLVVMKGQRKTAKLYVLQGSSVTGDTAVASSSLSYDDITKIWHMHLWLMSENDMAEFNKRGLIDRTRREIKPPKNYVEADLVAYALNVAEDIDANQESSNYSEAVSCEDSEKWTFAMQEEMESLHENRKWDLVKLPKVKHSSIQALLGILAIHDLELEQLDVKTAFLHGELEEDIYMQQPEGFIVSEKEDYSPKPVSTPLAAHFKLSSGLSTQSDDDIEYTSHVPYSSAVGSLMYAMFGRTRDGVIRYVDVDFAGDLNRRRPVTPHTPTPKCHTAKAHARVLGRGLHTAETHGRVSAHVITTMHTDLKSLRVGDTRPDHTPMG